MTIFELTLLLFASLLANGLSAMAGGGAGLLQLPVLIFLGLPFSMALATHKIASVALGVGATIKHAREGNTSLWFSLLMLLAGLPGVVLGANVILSIPATLAQILLGMLTISLGVYSYFKKSLGQVAVTKHRDVTGVVIGALGLFCIGFLNGSLTSGTGLFVTLWLILWFGFDFKRATAHTLIMVGLFWNGTGAVALAVQAPVRWDWLPALLLGAVAGGYLGAHFANKFGNPLIKRFFEVVTIAVGILLIGKSL